MNDKYINGIVCKLWSSAPIETGAGSITQIFKGVSSRRLADYAGELYSIGALDAVINLINRCHYAEIENDKHQGSSGYHTLYKQT